MFLCRNVYGLVNKLNNTSKRERFPAFWLHGYLKTQAFKGHGRKKCVWSGNKFDSTTKRECFSAFWVHGYLKTQAFMVHDREKMCIVWKQAGQYVKKRMFLCIFGAWIF